MTLLGSSALLIWQPPNETVAEDETTPFLLCCLGMVAGGLTKIPQSYIYSTIAALSCQLTMNHHLTSILGVLVIHPLPLPMTLASKAIRSSHLLASRLQRTSLVNSRLLGFRRQHHIDLADDPGSVAVRSRRQNHRHRHCNATMMMPIAPFRCVGVSLFSLMTMGFATIIP